MQTGLMDYWIDGLLETGDHARFSFHQSTNPLIQLSSGDL